MLFHYQTKRYSADVESKKGEYEHYNILPLYAVGVKPVIMDLPEVCMSGDTCIVSFASANDVIFLKFTLFMCFFFFSP